MAVHPRDGKLLYHLTSFDNLDSIVEHGLLSRAGLQARRLEFGDVADPGILDGRADHGLDQWVPFHFFPRNPFDGRVRKDHPTTTFVIIAVSRALAARQAWSVVPRHPLSDGVAPDVLPWSDGIKAIDWDRMTPGPDRDYRDKECKRVCMAEALKRDCVPAADFHSIYTGDAATARQVEDLLRGRIRPYVNVNGAYF